MSDCVGAGGMRENIACLHFVTQTERQKVADCRGAIVFGRSHFVSRNAVSVPYNVGGICIRGDSARRWFSLSVKNIHVLDTSPKGRGNFIEEQHLTPLREVKTYAYTTDVRLRPCESRTRNHRKSPFRHTDGAAKSRRLPREYIGHRRAGSSWTGN